METRTTTQIKPAIKNKAGLSQFAKGFNTVGDRTRLKIYYLTTLAVVAFLLHIIWENVQAPLYGGYQSFFQHLPICLIGAAGDVVITFLVLGVLLLGKKGAVQTVADFMALAVIGFIVAVVIEHQALLIGMWHYSSAMPIIPWLNVGLTPIMQMTILLPLSFYLAGLLNKTARHN